MPRPIVHQEVLPVRQAPLTVQEEAELSRKIAAEKVLFPRTDKKALKTFYRFFDLPREIRDRVYYLAMQSDHPRDSRLMQYYETRVRLEHVVPKAKHAFGSLLLTCRQTYEEALPVLFSTSMFTFPRYDILKVFVKMIGRNVALLKTLNLTIHSEHFDPEYILESAEKTLLLLRDAPEVRRIYFGMQRDWAHKSICKPLAELCVPFLIHRKELCGGKLTSRELLGIVRPRSPLECITLDASLLDETTIQQDMRFIAMVRERLGWSEEDLRLVALDKPRIA